MRDRGQATLATFHNDIIGLIWVPPLPSVRLPRDTTRWTIHGWPIQYPNAHL
jgi:hypothetical protein